ncbi:MAG: SGNH/GDSL hydrolase family protein [Verrucomicrobia bacterium]|nr:SGNH/GDSL hydrolase family protein [Verrucomicrobiota bacterium]
MRGRVKRKPNKRRVFAVSPRLPSITCVASSLKTGVLSSSEVSPDFTRFSLTAGSLRAPKGLRPPGTSTYIRRTVSPAHTMNRILLLSATLAALHGATVPAATPPLLPQGARLAIIGDSITEQKLYTKYMETYLLACAGRSDMKVFQFGWSGERADGFANRAANDLAAFKPTVATTCYGMNDGGYQPWKDSIGQAYEANMRNVLRRLDEAGVKHIVVGSPGAVDSKFFGARPSFGGANSAAGYNDTLAHLRDLCRKLATEHNLGFADVHAAMFDTMPRAKAALGDDYPVCGGDGFHPGPNGQLLMAYAFLKGLGVDGDLGTIVVDQNGAPSATGGHKVLNSGGGKVELESARYPFCFDPDPKSANSTRSITPFVPFNQDLNRLTLKVRNLATAKAKVTWGATSKEFSREQLETGVNLAAEFPATPFDAPFAKVMDAVGRKQAFETQMIKGMVTNFRQFANDSKADPGLGAAFNSLRDRLAARQQALDAEVRKAIVPVKHTLAIAPAQ